MLTAEEQAAFLNAAAGVKQSALVSLGKQRSDSSPIAFVSNLQRGVDQVVMAAAQRGLQFDCRAGCSHCCHVRVEALEPEVFRIARELGQLAPEELNPIIERLRRHATAVAGVGRHEHRAECPFLQARRCSIYELRPAVCRKTHSLDVNKCAAVGAEIPQDLDTVLKSEALLQGTADAYRALGLAASGHELGQAVLFALTDETAQTRWLAGESVFTACLTHTTEVLTMPP